MKTFLSILFFLFIGISLSDSAFAQQKRSLLSVIKDIEQSSEMRFLFREALISNIKVDVDITESSALLFEELETELKNFDIGLQLDLSRNQALLYKTDSQSSQKNISISGYVLDAKSGDRLPYSTVSWFENGEIKGIASNKSGVFNASVSTSQPQLTLLFSFIGYDSKKITLDIDNTINWTEIPVRLDPIYYAGNEIIVNGTSLYSPADTVFSSLIKVGAFSPLGDNNTIQALQSLPSVTSGPAIQDGINVRGSSGDGFRILLDGLTLYNQSHLFGLLDGLNGDILRTSGFFYDVTPAQYRAPLGGTLSFLTKTGNLQHYVGTAAISNTAFSTTLEGPLSKAKSSFLISGRHSFLNNMNWFNNQGIVEYGLDINRKFEFEEDTINEIRTRNISDANGSATFYDLHGKLYFETTSGSQFIISSYLGSDEASQKYERRIRSILEEFTTANNWSNELINLKYNTQLFANLYSESSMGFTSFTSSYLKEDASFKRINDNQGRFQEIEIQSLSLKNDLQEFQINQRFSQSLSAFDLDYGVSYSDFQVLYEEISPLSQSFRSRRTSQLLDVFAQIDITHSKDAHLSLGSRVYYFSNGKYLKWSPRIKTQFFPESIFSFGLGYSQNFQFLHQLEFQTINSTDFWIISNKDQPPSSANYFTSNIRIRPANSWYFQVEAYYKINSYLRIHSLTNQFVSSFFNSSDNNRPFLFNNDGNAKGLEFLVKKRVNNFNISSTYTLSSSELENDLINNGEPFNPSYDRTHQFSLSSDIEINRGLNLYTSWTYATGTPGSLFDRNIDPDSRIGDYSRVDISLRYLYKFEGVEKAEFQFSVYNLLNRENPWYAQSKAGLSTESNRVLLGSGTVYDLGIQPSFRVKFYF